MGRQVSIRWVDAKVDYDAPEPISVDLEDGEYVVSAETLTDGGYYSPWRRIWIWKEVKSV